MHRDDGAERKQAREHKATDQDEAKCQCSATESTTVPCMLPSVREVRLAPAMLLLALELVVAEQQGRQRRRSEGDSVLHIRLEDNDEEEHEEGEKVDEEEDEEGDEDDSSN